MDHETRRLEAARSPSAQGATAASPVGENGTNTPTTLLPPITPPANGGPLPETGYTLPSTPATGNGGPGPYSAPGWRQRSANPPIVPLVLIGLGLMALFGSFRYAFASAFPLALGLIFLYAGQSPSRWGLRIPGAILTGLGAGVLVDALLGFEGFSAVGLGLGFISLWFTNRGQWWWLIPGAAIGLGGLQAVLGDNLLHGNYFFPLVLIVAGGYMLMQRRRGFRI